jgi:predicted nuclease of predicted toxin-antitoxin system
VRLLFDEQLSEDLVLLVADLFPGSLHVRSAGGQGAEDQTIWQMAQEHGCALVTKDEDFHRLSVLRGAPPKVIWLRIGNCTTNEIARLLRHRTDELRMFDAQDEATFLELG